MKHFKETQSAKSAQSAKSRTDFVKGLLQILVIKKATICVQELLLQILIANWRQKPSKACWQNLTANWQQKESKAC